MVLITYIYMPLSNRVSYIDYIALAIVLPWGFPINTQYRVVGRYVRSSVHVPSDTLRSWEWSPTPERYLFLRAPSGPGSGPPPPKMLSSIDN